MTEPMHELLTNPRFAAVVYECLEEEELIEGFEKIYGIKRPSARRAPIEIMVDEATGFAESEWKAFFEGFIKFVYDCVWIRWPERNNQECWS